MEIWRSSRERDILILGEAPATEDQEVPLKVLWCRKRLVTDHGWEGWPHEHFDVANVFDEPQPLSASGKGCSFDVTRAILALSGEGIEDILSYPRVVVLGRAWTAVQGALSEMGCGMDNEVCAPCQLAQCRSTLFLRWPHPSGMARYWNDEEVREAAYATFRAFVGKPPNREMANYMSTVRLP